MTNKQENKRSMYLAVQKVCKQFSSVWATIVAFVSAFADFEAIIKKIEDARLIQAGKTIGATELKQKEEDEMIEITIMVAAAIYAYATDIKDYELRSKVDYSPSDLQGLPDTELKDVCQLIHDIAAGIGAALVNYGITGTVLTQHQKEIDDYKDIMAKPRTAIVTKATATGELVGYFKDGDNILNNKLDKLMEQFKTSEPTFYNSYHSARIIVDLGTRHEKEEGEEK